MRTPLVVAALLVALLGGACSADRSDGLVLYSGRSEALIAPLLEDFTRSTGIKVTTRYGNSAELAAQLLEAGARTPASAFLSQDAGALGALEEAGRLTALDSAVLDRVPSRYRSAKGVWVGVSGRSRVLIYNPRLVPAAQLPASVYDLTKPAYRGRVAYAPTNASFQSFVTGMRVLGGADRTRSFLEGFKANDPRAFEGNAQIVDAVNGGEIAMGLVNHYYLYEKAAEAGGLDKVVARNHQFPGDDPGSLVNVAGVAVLSDKQGEDSRALVDFLLSRPAQTYFADRTKEYPLIAGVPTSVPELPPIARVTGPDVDLAKLDTLAQTLALLDEVGLT